MNPYREAAAEVQKEKPDNTWAERVYIVGVVCLPFIALVGIGLCRRASINELAAERRLTEKTLAPACHDSIYTAIENHKLECPHASQTLGLFDGNIVCRCSARDK